MRETKYPKQNQDNVFSVFINNPMIEILGKIVKLMDALYCLSENCLSINFRFLLFIDIIKKIY